MVGIYKITNLINMKSYIGQSINITKRFAKHQKIAFDTSDKHYNYPLYKAIRKYGIDNFSFDIIEECKRSELNEKEIYYIAHYDTYRNGYNQDQGGTCASHYTKLSNELVSRIIHRLKTSTDSSDEIGEDFGISGKMVRNINSGNSCYQDGVTYPIRPPLNPCRKNNPQKMYSRREKNNNDNNDALYCCEKCGSHIVTKGAKLCTQCVHEMQRRAERPSAMILAGMIKELGFAKTGKHFGVSGNTVKKWCKTYNIPHMLNDLIAWYNSELATADSFETD
jgi:hypothetical protein